MTVASQTKNEQQRQRMEMRRAHAPLFVALFLVLLGFVFAVLGLAGTLLDSGDTVGFESALGIYLRSHGLLLGVVALVVTALVFVRIFAIRDKCGLTMARPTTYVAALGIFDAASFAIASL